MKRNTVIVIVLLLALLYAAATIGEGWWRADGLVARDLSVPGKELTPARLSPAQLRLLLAVEDPAFFTHHGVDLHTPGAGFTTITQGLVKFLYFGHFHPGVGKIRQTLLAVGFDARIPKKEQLRLFLNDTYLGRFRGREVHGFEDGARTYFGTSFGHLSPGQWAALVAMVIGPDQYNVALQPQRNRDRVARIQALISGRCRPRGWLDVTYRDCPGAAFSASP